MWNSKPFVIFIIVVTSISVMFLAFAWRTVQFHEYLLHNGIQTQGKIIEHYFGTGSRGYGQNHYFVYRFLDSRERPFENQIIRNEPENRFGVGQNVEIIYDPLNPSRNIPSNMMPDDIYQPIYSSLKFIVVALGVTLAFGAFVFSRFAQTRLRWESLKRLVGIVDR